MDGWMMDSDITADFWHYSWVCLFTKQTHSSYHTAYDNNLIKGEICLSLLVLGNMTIHSYDLSFSFGKLELVHRKVVTNVTQRGTVLTCI